MKNYSTIERPAPERCAATTRPGNPCRNRATVGPCCGVHAQHLDSLPADLRAEVRRAQRRETRAEREKLKEMRQVNRVLRHLTPALEAAEKLQNKKLAGRVQAAHTMVGRYSDKLFGDDDEQGGDL